ncbi:MAG: FAD-binding oxidoreductase [Crocinitomicaceae bacterium]|nr:FAD-binding oxidoreductase [Crocinitomicaceae bacterium]
MILSFWRKSHLILAISSFLFLIITTLTGVILSFKPIAFELHEANINKVGNKNISTLINELNSKFDEIIEIKVDKNNLLKLSLINKGEYQEFFADPDTLKKKVSEIETSKIFKYAEIIHRSLFLGVVGRFFIGLSSFFLLLISVSGIILLLKRQISPKNFFKKINKVGFYEDWHAILARASIVFILIIALSGSILSMNRFGLLPQKNEINHNLKPDKFEKYNKIRLEKFQIFQETNLKKLESIQFPFSSDKEDYFKVKLKDKELIINQFNGEIISESKIENLTLFKQLSYNLHTGKGNVIWSIILFVSCLNILFFIFSGYKMALKRFKSKKRNYITKDISDIVILVGSENGSTMQIAKEFKNNIIKTSQNIFIDELNNYTLYKNLKHLIIFTSTYGDGSPPSNANKFISKFEKIKQPFDFNFSIVGFGSKTYPKFCQFAKDISTKLKKQTNCYEFIPLKLINEKSIESLNKWSNDWSKKMNVQIKKINLKNLVSYKIYNKTIPNQSNNQTFLLEINLSKKDFKSGDLIAITDLENKVERYYSLGQGMNGLAIICVRKIPNGICSSYLSEINIGSNIRARIEKNKNFNLPKDAEKIIAISNGTGITPFIGMGYENKNKIDFHIYWGGKSKNVLKVFEPHIKKLKDKKLINEFKSVFSQENKNSKYVQDIILNNQDFISNSIYNGSKILICGSIVMRDEVLKIIDEILKNKLKKRVSDFETQIHTDCY